MQANSYLLKGGTVEAARVVEKVDRQIIFPTKEQVKTASNGYDLLDNLSLPTIIVNRAERKVLSLKGGDVQIRINDVKASMQDVLDVYKRQEQGFHALRLCGSPRRYVFH